MLRLLDVLVLRKDDAGSISRLLLEDHELGDLLARVVPPEAAALFALVAGDESGTHALAESLAPGGLLVFLLVEHRWARPLFDAIAEARGVLVDVGFMTVLQTAQKQGAALLDTLQAHFGAPLVSPPSAAR